MSDFMEGLTGEFMFARTAVGVEEDSLTGLIAECADSFEATLLDHRIELNRIREKVMPDSRRAAGQGAADASQERLNAFQPALDKLQTAISMSEGLTLAPQVRHRIPSNVNAEDSHRAEVEARVHIRGLNDIDRKATYLDACRSGDVQTVRAYELSPTVAPLVDADTIAEGAELFAATNTPAEYDMLEQQRATARSIQSDLNRATRELGVVARSGELVA